MKQERYWMIFHIATYGVECQWVPSNTRLSVDDAHMIMNMGTFSFDFLRYGLDLAGTISTVTGFHIVYGTKKDAEKLADKLNKEGGSPFKFADEGSEELDWCESETSGDGVQGNT